MLRHFVQQIAREASKDGSASIFKIKQSRFLKKDLQRSSEHRNLFTSGNDRIFNTT